MDVTPSGLAARVLRSRRMARAPIGMYRAGLGGVLGRRLVMIEHRGRRTGRARYVCVEVVDHPAPGRLIVASGFGRSADWYLNLQRHPTCFVSWGSIRRAPAVATMLSEGRSLVVLREYQDCHPRMWSVLRRTLQKATGNAVSAIPMVELSFGERSGRGGRR